MDLQETGLTAGLQIQIRRFKSLECPMLKLDWEMTRFAIDKPKGSRPNRHFVGSSEGPQRIIQLVRPILAVLIN